jgi:hypothetical protein
MTGTVAGGDGPAGTKHERLTALIQYSVIHRFERRNKQKIFVAGVVSSFGPKKHAPRRHFLSAKKANGREKVPNGLGLA